MSASPVDVISVAAEASVVDAKLETVPVVGEVAAEVKPAEEVVAEAKPEEVAAPAADAAPVVAEVAAEAAPAVVEVAAEPAAAVEAPKSPSSGDKRRAERHADEETDGSAVEGVKAPRVAEEAAVVAAAAIEAEVVEKPVEAEAVVAEVKAEEAAPAAAE